MRLRLLRRAVCGPFLPFRWHSIALRWYRSAVCGVSAGTRLPCGWYRSAVRSFAVLLALDCPAVVLVCRGVCGSFLLALDYPAVDIGLLWRLFGVCLLALCRSAVDIGLPCRLSFVPAGSVSTRLPCGWYCSAVGLFSVFGLVLLALDCRAVDIGPPCGLSFVPAVLLALYCRAVLLVRRVSVCGVWAGSASPLLPCGGIAPPWRPSVVRSCRSASSRLPCDIGFAVASVCVSFLRFC